VILIGTNDLGKNRCSPEYVIAGILSVVKYVQTQRPGIPILLHGLLPRGENSRDMSLGIRWKLIQVINGHLRAFCENHHSVYYMDSGDIFLSQNATMIDKKLMHDALHPTLKGGRRWVPLAVERIHRIIG
jgi:lysophospholipase L1-like esterase